MSKVVYTGSSQLVRQAQAFRVWLVKAGQAVKLDSIPHSEGQLPLSFCQLLFVIQKNQAYNPRSSSFSIEANNPNCMWNFLLFNCLDCEFSLLSTVHVSIEQAKNKTRQNKKHTCMWVGGSSWVSSLLSLYNNIIALLPQNSCSRSSQSVLPKHSSPCGSIFFLTSLLEYNCFTWCVSFCCMTKWISYTYTHIPISPPSCISLPPSLPIPPL